MVRWPNPVLRGVNLDPPANRWQLAMGRLANFMMHPRHESRLPSNCWGFTLLKAGINLAWQEKSFYTNQLFYCIMKDQKTHPLTKLDEHLIWTLICEIERRSDRMSGGGFAMPASMFGETTTAVWQRLQSLGLFGRERAGAGS
jgi:hypothetical protein